MRVPFGCMCKSVHSANLFPDVANPTLRRSIENSVPASVLIEQIRTLPEFKLGRRNRPVPRATTIESAVMPVEPDSHPTSEPDRLEGATRQGTPTSGGS